jgi:hypothetical protein
LGQEIRIMKFAVTHTKQPPSSWRHAARGPNRSDPEEFRIFHSRTWP